jgi:56kDa selenium binding protein (SBP56)
MSEAPAAHAHQGPGYASPQAAREQSPEKYVYVAALYEGTGIDRPDFLAVVDVDPTSNAAPPVAAALAAHPWLPAGVATHTV